MQYTGRTAGEAGWRISRYNISAPVPGAEKMIIANLFRMTCGVYTPAELYLLDELAGLDEGHPILKRFAERGLIVNFDERAALESMARVACGDGHTVTLCICPTMAVGFPGSSERRPQPIWMSLPMFVLIYAMSISGGYAERRRRRSRSLPGAVGTAYLRSFSISSV